MSALKAQQKKRKFRRTIAALVASATVIMSTAVVQSVPASAQDLIVKYDQSQLLRLPRRVSEIIIGNPSIADVTVQSGKLLVVTGKTFGITNIIALDQEKQIIIDKRVLVTRPTGRVVNLMKGGARQSYNCAPDCNPSLVIGDDTKYFDSIGKSAQAKVGMSQGGGGGGGSGSPGGQ